MVEEVSEDPLVLADRVEANCGAHVVPRDGPSSLTTSSSSAASAPVSNHPSQSSSSAAFRNRQYNNFANQKKQCLSKKRDKSSAGRIDAGAVAICGLLNGRDHYCTTSSCAGRCFLYRGAGVKANGGNFVRYRVSHDAIRDAPRYFDLRTLDTDPTGGADAINTEFDGGRRGRQQQQQQRKEEGNNNDDNVQNEEEQQQQRKEDTNNTVIWLRYEPFILHVACRSLAAAAALLNTARPTFKNVGLTTWKQQQQQQNDGGSNNSNSSKYLVAIWGDEGLEMPLTNQDGVSMILGGGGSSSTDTNQNSNAAAFAPEWLAELVNERHERNAAKIARLVEAVRSMGPVLDDDGGDHVDDCEMDDNENSSASNTQQVKVPRSYDVIGDVAVLHSLSTQDPAEQQAIGAAILQKNKAVKVVALRSGNLTGTERAANHNLQIIAGTHRDPLMTTHREYGIACLVDLQHTFFSPRMGPERLRIAQQVATGEHVLVLFAGVCLDALQVAARSRAATATAVEQNAAAVRCARRSHQLLSRNAKGVQCAGAADRLRIVEGDCRDVLPTLPRNHYHRVLAPRPKEGSSDGNQPDDDNDNNNNDESTGGAEFLAALLPVLKQNGGVCHWYDFAADHEFPKCERTVRMLTRVCRAHGRALEVLHVAHAGSVAMRQLRVCVDFRVAPLEDASK